MYALFTHVESVSLIFINYLRRTSFLLLFCSLFHQQYVETCLHFRNKTHQSQPLRFIFKRNHFDSIPFHQQLTLCSSHGISATCGCMCLHSQWVPSGKGQMTVTRQPVHIGKDRFTVKCSFWRPAEKLLAGGGSQSKVNKQEGCSREKHRFHSWEQVTQQGRPIRAQSSLLYSLDWLRSSGTKVWEVI